MPAILLAPVAPEELAVDRGLMSTFPSPHLLAQGLLTQVTETRTGARLRVPARSDSPWRSAVIRAANQLAVPVDANISTSAGGFGMGTGAQNPSGKLFILEERFDRLLRPPRQTDVPATSATFICDALCDSPELANAWRGPTILYVAPRLTTRDSSPPLLDQEISGRARAVQAFGAAAAALAAMSLAADAGDLSRSAVALRIAEERDRGSGAQPRLSRADGFDAEFWVFRLVPGRYPGVPLRPIE